MKETVEYKSAQTIEVKVGPHNRDQYLKNLMELEGLEDTHEDPKAAFWPIGPSRELVEEPVTRTPPRLEPIVPDSGNRLKAQSFTWL